MGLVCPKLIDGAQITIQPNAPPILQLSRKSINNGYITNVSGISSIPSSDVGTPGFMRTDVEQGKLLYIYSIIVFIWYVTPSVLCFSWTYIFSKLELSPVIKTTLKFEINGKTFHEYSWMRQKRPIDYN